MSSKHVNNEQVIILMDQDLNDILDLRQDRLHHITSHVPQVVWVVLLISSFIVIAFACCFHLPSLIRKRSYIAVLSSIIAMSLFLIYMLDHPFTGSSQISSMPYLALRQSLEKSARKQPIKSNRKARENH